MKFFRTLKKLKYNFVSLSLALAVSLTTLPYIAEPIQVQATELTNAGGTGGNGEGADGGQGTQVVTNGPKASKQFWLLYITDENGSVKSPVAMYKSQDFSTDMTYILTRPEHGSLAPSIIDTTTPAFGWSFNERGQGRGTLVKQWMIQKDSVSGQPQAATVIEQLWGTDMAEQWVANQWYLCLENGMWCNIYLNGRDTGVSFAGTSYGWGAIQNTLGLPEKGDSKISRYTNSVLPNSSRLQFTQTGVQKPVNSGKVTNTDMILYGHGMVIIWAGDLGAQTTCDEPLQPAPHPAPLESQGKTTIVKNYRTLQSDNTYTDDGCHARTNVSNKIIIEEEEEYKVVGWVTTNATTSPIDSITTTNTNTHRGVIFLHTKQIPKPINLKSF